MRRISHVDLWHIVIGLIAHKETLDFSGTKHAAVAVIRLNDVRDLLDDVDVRVVDFNVKKLLFGWTTGALHRSHGLRITTSKPDESEIGVILLGNRFLRDLTNGH